MDTTTPTGTYHHTYAEFGGRWFCAYHTSPAGDDYHRRVCVDELFYNADGTIQKIIQTSTGPEPVTGTMTPEPVTDLGDVNSDRTINIVDALLLAQFYVGPNPLNFNQNNADTNCDGSINIGDALLIAQYYVDLISTFC